MGRWGDGFFDDDIALDLKDDFEQSVSAGGSPEKIASGLLRTQGVREILDEWDESERDEMFWEECRGLIFAVAFLQAEYDVVQEETRELALKAIEQARLSGAPDVQLQLLRELEQRLR